MHAQSNEGGDTVASYVPAHHTGKILQASKFSWEEINTSKAPNYHEYWLSMQLGPFMVNNYFYLAIRILAS